MEMNSGMGNYPPTTMMLNPLAATAALDEMRVWVPIMEEHSKFIRGGLDPNPSNEEAFRTADRFAQEFHKLHMAVQSVPAENIPAIASLIQQSMTLTTALRNFKVKLYEALVKCQAVAELPAALLDHVRREADFFLHNLSIITGRGPLPHAVLGIPNGVNPANILPRMLIPEAGPNLLRVARDENLFHLRIQEEHGEVLLLVAYRPKIQDALYQETARFEKKIERLRAEALNLPCDPNSILCFNNKVRSVMMRWYNFLKCTHAKVISCQVPSGQINTDALILDHMAREVAYYISVIDIICRALV